MTPTDLIKIQMQNDRSKFNSLFKVGGDIYKDKGIKGLYKGFFATLNRDFYSYGAYFYVYFALTEHWERNNNLTEFKKFFAGGLGGIISWLICYPFDPIKTLIQTTYGEKTMTQMEAIRYIREKHGLIGFMRGINSVLVMSFFRHGVIFYTNDLCLKYFSYLNDVKH